MARCCSWAVASTPHASMRLHNWQVFAAVLRSGDIGLAEGYIAQDWSTPTWPTCCAC